MDGVEIQKWKYNVICIILHSFLHHCEVKSTIEQYIANKIYKNAYGYERYALCSSIICNSLFHKGRIPSMSILIIMQCNLYMFVHCFQSPVWVPTYYA